MKSRLDGSEIDHKGDNSRPYAGDEHFGGNTATKRPPVVSGLLFDIDNGMSKVKYDNISDDYNQEYAKK